MEKVLPKDMQGIQQTVQRIFDPQGGATLVWLGECLGKEVREVNSTQLRKFLTELKSVRADDPLSLHRFRWVNRYLVAQSDKKQNLKVLGDYLEAAAKYASEKVDALSEAEKKQQLRRLQDLMESVYANYSYQTDK